MKGSLCFFFPYHEDSGVPVLFYRLANTIAASNPDIQVSVIDFENGSMWRNLIDLPNINKIKFKVNEPVSPPDGSVLIFQSLLPYYWPKELIIKPDQRLLFWNLHPYNLIPSLLPLPLLRDLTMSNYDLFKIVAKFYPKLLRKLKQFVEILLSNHGLYFMDKSNLELTEKYLYLKIINRQFLPVPADFVNNEVNYRAKKQLDEIVKFGWIGRLCDFKSYILIYAIQCLNNIACNFEGRKFQFHIVGSGPMESYIKRAVSKCDSVEIIYHGYLPHKQIDNFLKDVDILFAMGTSALEGAKLGIPTILLDPILKKVKGDYVFRMLQDTDEYDLGHFISNKDFIRNNTSLNDLLVNIFQNYETVSNDVLTYFLSNHHLEKVKDTFLEKTANTTLTYSKLRADFFEKPKLLEIYNLVRGLKS